jgi:molybdenum cofactor sulfurtransferase
LFYLSLPPLGKTYLDHGGTTIYAKSLIENFSASLISNLYGNPHSASTPAILSGQIVDDTRLQALSFFGADPEHFDLIFVANATAAIKLVMDSFKDLSTADGTTDPGFWYGYHIDSHNSLVGVRECSSDYNLFSTDAEVESWLSSSPGASSINPKGKLGLFAYPGQSNMTGRRLPITWAGALRSSANPAHIETYTLFDAAALATTAPLHPVFADPSSAPDFTALSFYKIFGFPDLGGLIVRKASGRILPLRRYFGGGTISLVTVEGAKPLHEKRELLHQSLEDGTQAFHSIIALQAAIETHERLYRISASDGQELPPGSCMQVISKHTTFLAKKLFDAMSGLRHANGAPVIKIYNGTSGPSTYGDPKTQGATMSFNVLRSDGTYMPYTSAVERAADARGIYLRSGQLCNPGGIGQALGLGKWQVQRLWEYGYRCGRHEESGTEVFRGKATGVVRVSMGAMTRARDVDTLINFLQDEFVLDDTVMVDESESPIIGRGLSLGRTLSLEEGIALVIREKDSNSDSFSDIEEEPQERSGSPDIMDPDRVGTPDISERVASPDIGSATIRSDGESVDALSQSHAELKSYEIVPAPPRSYSSSITRVNAPSTLAGSTSAASTAANSASMPSISNPIVEEKRRPIVHVISVQEFEMSRSKIVIRPSPNGKQPIAPKKEEHGLKRLLSTKVRPRKSTSALERVSMI